jgi:hypothetical protein
MRGIDMTKAIVKARKNNQVVVYQEPRFDDLNKAIEQLGTHSGDLKKEEKEIGFKLLNEWEQNVIERIKDKEQHLSAILKFFGIENSWYSLESGEYESMKQTLADVSKTNTLYSKYKNLKEKLELHKLEKPTRPNVNPNITIIENDKLYIAYEKEYLEWEIEDKRLRFDKDKIRRKWVNKMKTTDGIKEMISGVQEYKRKVKGYIRECKDKSHLAKINLTISNDKAKESIREIINFTKSI